jgi:hypothetical protein
MFFPVHEGVQRIYLLAVQVEIVQHALSQSLGVFASLLVPKGNGVSLMPSDTSGVAQTVRLSQCLESVDHLLFGSAQVEERSASVLRKGFPTGIALEELGALLAIAPVANDIPTASHSMIATFLIGARELSDIHGRHLLKGHNPRFRKP